MTVSIDPHSLTWRVLKQHLNSERDSALDELIEGSRQDDELRGKIKFIDEILKLEEEPPDKPPQHLVSYT